MDLDNSTAIDAVRGILRNDLPNARDKWLLVAAQLATDLQAGIRTAGPDMRFATLTPAEQSNLNTLQAAVEALDPYLTNGQCNPDEWITCFGCVSAFRLPASKETWETHLITCSQNVDAARQTIVNDTIAATTAEVEAWVLSERKAAQDAAINSLDATNPSFTSAQLLSDARVVEWSRRIREAMITSINDSNVDVAALAFPPELFSRLQAERQAKLDTAKSDACEEAKRLYYAELNRLQSEEYEKAQVAFETWRDTICLPEWQAKDDTLREQKVREHEALKHALNVEANEAKEAARLVELQSLKHDKPTAARKAGRKAKRVDPIQGSRSSSRTPSRAPSPCGRGTRRLRSCASWRASWRR